MNTQKTCFPKWIKFLPKFFIDPNSISCFNFFVCSPPPSHTHTLPLFTIKRKRETVNSTIKMMKIEFINRHTYNGQSPHPPYTSSHTHEHTHARTFTLIYARNTMRKENTFCTLWGIRWVSFFTSFVFFFSLSFFLILILQSGLKWSRK